MKQSIHKAVLAAVVGIFCAQPMARAQALDQIGVTLLRATTTNLNGAGIRVAQPEGGYDQGTNWEVNPAVVSHPLGFLTYISASGSTTNFPNSISSESGHANDVGRLFYGMSYGVATNVVHVDNYDANHFYNDIVAAINPPAITNSVVNQSFSFGAQTASVQQQIDSQYDDYAAQFRTLFVSAVDNGGNVHAPGTSYNCIGVAAYAINAATSIGPTIDNGRCKPDIIAPASTTSYATPQVSGAAAILIQAVFRGDGGSDTNSAVDIRTIKALLLNGATKPVGWTNGNSTPLDARYGAGVVNIFNSYRQLIGGKSGFIVSMTYTNGAAHPPTGAAGSVGVLCGWDFNTNTSTSLPTAQITVKHYYFDVTNGPNDFIGTATLAWNRQQNKSGINNLDLFLYNCANSNLVACSTSLVDNVEHIFVPKLESGRYDLQVLMNASGVSPINNTEPYALAFSFVASPLLTLAKSGTNMNLSWPFYPASLHVETTPDLIASAWTTNQLPAIIFTNSQNLLLLNPTNAAQFFRLHQP